MPKSVRYHANSIVYFKGDVNDKVYILKSGKVSLNYNDIETGQEMHDLINTGEFFGVKSALGKYPREETAVVLKDADVMVFTVPEFEAVVSNNTRVILKMLKVFSNQLRRIHKQVRNLLSAGSAGMDPEEGLFRIGQYYMNSRKYHQALYAFRRYITYYPSGKYASEANRNSELAEQYIQQHGNTPGSPPGQDTASASTAPKKQPNPEELSAVAKRYYNAVSLYSQQKYREALKEFQEISSNGDQEYAAKAFYEIGRCLYGLEQYEQCIQHYTKMIKQFPKHPDLRDALIYVGNSHERLENPEKAKGFYKKVLSMSSENEVVYRKAKRALQKMERG
jgi:TolA-binding protein